MDPEDLETELMSRAELLGYYKRLLRAYYSGATSITYSGNNLVYKSSEQMWTIIQNLKRELKLLPSRVNVRLEYQNPRA